MRRERPKGEERWDSEGRPPKRSQTGAMKCLQGAESGRAGAVAERQDSAWVWPKGQDQGGCVIGRGLGRTGCGAQVISPGLERALMPQVGPMAACLCWLGQAGPLAQAGPVGTLEQRDFGGRVPLKMRSETGP